MKQCIECGVGFAPHPMSSNKQGGFTQKYCSNKCRTEKLSSPWRGILSTSNVGAMAEILVCADLLSRQYEVYRNVSPNGINDVVAYKEGQYYGIDVKSGYRKNDKLYPYSKNYKSDYRAIVIHRTKEIIYQPELK